MNQSNRFGVYLYISLISAISLFPLSYGQLCSLTSFSSSGTLMCDSADILFHVDTRNAQSYPGFGSTAYTIKSGSSLTASLIKGPSPSYDWVYNSTFRAIHLRNSLSSSDPPSYLQMQTVSNFRAIEMWLFFDTATQPNGYGMDLRGIFSAWAYPYVGWQTDSTCVSYINGVQNGNSLPLNKWFHTAFVLGSSATGAIPLFVNNAKTLGGLRTMVTEIRVWSLSLSALQVQAVYNATREYYETKQWEFRLSSATPAVNSSSTNPVLFNPYSSLYRYLNISASGLQNNRSYTLVITSSASVVAGAPLWSLMSTVRTPASGNVPNFYVFSKWSGGVYFSMSTVSLLNHPATIIPSTIPTLVSNGSSSVPQSLFFGSGSISASPLMARPIFAPGALTLGTFQDPAGNLMSGNLGFEMKHGGGDCDPVMYLTDGTNLCGFSIGDQSINWFAYGSFGIPTTTFTSPPSISYSSGILPPMQSTEFFTSFEIEFSISQKQTNITAVRARNIGTGLVRAQVIFPDVYVCPTPVNTTKGLWMVLARDNPKENYYLSRMSANFSVSTGSTPSLIPVGTQAQTVFFDDTFVSANSAGVSVLIQALPTISILPQSNNLTTFHPSATQISVFSSGGVFLLGGTYKMYLVPSDRATLITTFPINSAAFLATTICTNKSLISFNQFSDFPDGNNNFRPGDLLSPIIFVGADNALVTLTSSANFTLLPIWKSTQPPLVDAFGRFLWHPNDLRFSTISLIGNFGKTSKGFTCTLQSTSGVPQFVTTTVVQLGNSKMLCGSRWTKIGNVATAGIQLELVLNNANTGPVRPPNDVAPKFVALSEITA